MHEKDFQVVLWIGLVEFRNVKITATQMRLQHDRDSGSGATTEVSANISPAKVAKSLGSNLDVRQWKGFLNRRIQATSALKRQFANRAYSVLVNSMKTLKDFNQTDLYGPPGTVVTQAMLCQPEPYAHQLYPRASPR